MKKGAAITDRRFSDSSTDSIVKLTWVQQNITLKTVNLSNAIASQFPIELLRTAFPRDLFIHSQ